MRTTFETLRLVITTEADAVVNHDDAVSAVTRHARGGCDRPHPAAPRNDAAPAGDGERCSSVFRDRHGTAFRVVTDLQLQEITIDLPPSPAAKACTGGPKSANAFRFFSMRTSADSHPYTAYLSRGIADELDRELSPMDAVFAIAQLHDELPYQHKRLLRTVERTLPGRASRVFHGHIPWARMGFTYVAAGNRLAVVSVWQVRPAESPRRDVCVIGERSTAEAQR